MPPYDPQLGPLRQRANELTLLISQQRYAIGVQEGVLQRVEAVKSDLARRRQNLQQMSAELDRIEKDIHRRETEGKYYPSTGLATPQRVYRRY